MEIIGIIGSLRPESLNRRVFNAYQTLASGHFKLCEGIIRDIPMYEQNLEDEKPASVTQLAQQIQRAAGVIFFTPEYNYSIPGVLKNAIDWLSRLDPQPFAGKATAIIGASPSRLGTARAQYHLRQVGVYLDMHFLNKPEIMLSQAHTLFDAQGKIDAQTEDYLAKHVNAFLEFIG